MPQPLNDNRPAIFRTVIILVVIFVAAAVALVRYSDDQAGLTGDAAAIAGLAECLTAKGAKMYGAVWCSHCARQKKAFGEAFAKIDYVECAEPGDPRAQTAACQAAGVTVYPTWTFADGSRLTGEVSFESLAAQAGCPFAAAVAPSAETTVAGQSPAAETSPVGE